MSKDQPHVGQITGLVVGTSYKIQVSSINQLGESELSPSTVFIYAERPSVI